MEQQQQGGRYTRGNIGRMMLGTGLAMLPGTLAMVGYNLADTFFVSRLGEVPLAAMGFTFPVIMLLSCAMRGVASGVMTPVAQALGGGRRLDATRLVLYGAILMMIVSILVAVTGMATDDFVFGLLDARGEALAQLKIYMNIWYFGCATAALGMLGNDMLIAAGHSKTASTMMITGMLINVPLDWVMIFGAGPIPAMGIAGAAWATVLSQLIGAAIIWTLLYKYGLFRLVKISRPRLFHAWRLIARYGMPSMLGMLLLPVGTMVTTKVTAAFGTAAVAGAAAGGRLESVAFAFPMALGMSLMPIMAQNYGAGLYDRIRRAFRFSMGFAFCFLLGAGMVFFVAAPWVAPFFSKESPDVRNVIILYLRIIPWGFFTLEIFRYATLVLSGCGRPAYAGWLAGLRILGLLIPLSLLALWCRSLPGLFAARLATDIIAGAIAFFFAWRRVNRLPLESGQPPPPETVGANVADSLVYPQE